MIVITGAAGFIGSNLAASLIKDKYLDLVLVDDFTIEIKKANYDNKTGVKFVDRSMFSTWLDQNHKFVQFVFHIDRKSVV